jgi:hypothetical protein
MKPGEREYAIDFYGIGVEIYMGLKISKDGLAREEDVEVLRGMYEETYGKDIGQKIFKAVYGKKESDDGSKPA